MKRKSLDFEEEDTNRQRRPRRKASKKGWNCTNKKVSRSRGDVSKAALTLPGTGPIRFRKAKVAAGWANEPGSRRKVMAEILTAHYNRACCFAQMGEVDDGLECLNLAIENGFDDFKYLRSDADVAALKRLGFER